MTSDELKLKELAEAATPGPWKLEKDRTGEYWIMGDAFQAVCMISAQKLSAREEADARLIASAPTAILSLLARIEALEQDAKHLHVKLAGETLRADQGWERYEAANRSRNALESAIGQQNNPK